MKNIKISVDGESHSIDAQIALFELGAKWYGDKPGLARRTTMPFLYTNGRGWINYGRNTKNFHEHPNREVTLEDLKQMLKEKRMGQKNQDIRRPVQITKGQAQQMIESGCEISKRIAYDTYPELRPPQLPKRWEDVDLMENTCYVDRDNQIQHVSKAITAPANKNLLPNTNVAEAHRVVPELITMREIYRDGWVPSKSNSGWGVYYDTGMRKWLVGLVFNHIFRFPTEEVARTFLDNFEPQLKTYAKLYK